MFAWLLTAGAAFALAAVLVALRLGDRARAGRAAALFTVMLAMLLGQLYPGFFPLFGAVAIAAALAYTISALRGRRAPGGEDRHDR